MWSIALFVFVACSMDNRPDPVPPAPVEAPAPGPAVEQPEPSAKLPNTPQELYETCRERVEGPQQAGECSSDDDCAASGCNKEVCVPSSVGEGMMSACEITPCFQVLDSCGCNDGMCTWRLKQELPQGAGAPEGDPGVSGD